MTLASFRDMLSVAKSAATPEDRVKILLDWHKQLPPREGVLRLRTVSEAVRWGDEWQAQAEKMELLHDLARIQADMSEALLADALAECERLRALLG